MSRLPQHTCCCRRVTSSDRVCTRRPLLALLLAACASLRATAARWWAASALSRAWRCSCRQQPLQGMSAQCSPTAAPLHLLPRALQSETVMLPGPEQC
jgi:hypothetical protein